MKYSIKLVFCLCLVLLFFGSLKAQHAFSMVNIDTDKTRTFRFGCKVLFELKNKSVLDSTMDACLNQETGVYEMKLTKLFGQDLVFNDSILVPYSQIKWMFIETPGRVVKLFFGYFGIGTLVPLYGMGIEYGLFASILFLPPSIIFLSSSQRHYYSTEYWAIKPSMVGAKFKM